MSGDTPASSASKRPDGDALAEAQVRPLPISEPLSQLSLSPSSPTMSPQQNSTSTTTTTSSSIEPSSYEHQHVHTVYQSIASHFSDTRYKPWPQVSSFLDSLPPGAVGIDAGCGNGKYVLDFGERMRAREQEGTAGGGGGFVVGSDYSANLAKIAAERCQPRPRGRDVPEGGSAAADGGDERSQSHGQGQIQGQGQQQSNPLADVVTADILALPHPRHRFDFAISVAVVHHLSTRDRRVAAVREVLSCLRRGTRTRTGTGTSAKAETGGDHGRDWDHGSDWDWDLDGGQALFVVWALEQKNSRRGWDEGGDQDVMVPWVLQDGKKTKQPRQKLKVGRKGRDGADGDGGGDGSAPAAEPAQATSTAPTASTFLRYYHLYARGELEDDVRAAGGRVVRAGYNRDNWWVVAALAVDTDADADAEAEEGREGEK